MAATLINRTVVSVSVFNDIRTFEEQDWALNPRILKVIASIFVQNQMHHRYRAEILHRHQELKKDCVMIHTERSVDIDVCQSKSLSELNVTQLVPTLLFLNENHIFQGCEYDINDEEMKLLNAKETTFAAPRTTESTESLSISNHIPLGCK